ncbi:CLI_3235 family bacteriocin precursor [Vallitalea maricola]|uniref:Uncharacterized protein n=1 Tax=Vallitalea maricola TaxID=3074433 RepID=A0ACB5UPW3_9FIRM|nr:hypothetical protein AN2V17_41470 [Vallitalea sp. AN17-2]
MKKLTKKANVAMETLEAYCSCSCPCYSCSCNGSSTNDNSYAMDYATYAGNSMDFTAINMV